MNEGILFGNNLVPPVSFYTASPVGQNNVFHPELGKDGTWLHECGMNPKNAGGGYGPAIDSIWLDDDSEWFAGNGEYVSQIFCCPWCGIRLEVVS